MVVTITVDDHLAARLQAQAAAQHLPVEALALQLLAAAVDNEDDAAWHAVNQRRMALIQKQCTDALSPDEVGELQHLQDMADQYLAPLDERLLDHVKHFHSQVQRMVDTSSC